MLALTLPPPLRPGIKVAPVKGRAVLFYSVRPDGAPDPFSLHGGCAVRKGVKWAVNQWVWTKPQLVEQYD